MKFLSCNIDPFLEMLFRDPNLWLVKCRQGEEKSTIIALQRKMIAYQFTEDVRISFTSVAGVL